MKYIAFKGTVKCQYCGFISLYGYQDRDKLCYKCNRGFFRFGAYETWNLNLNTQGKNYEEHQAEKI